jgi:hypothetical protein
MLISGIHIGAWLLVWLAALKLIELHLVRNNPESSLGQALAFLVG